MAAPSWAAWPTTPVQLSDLTFRPPLKLKAGPYTPDTARLRTARPRPPLVITTPAAPPPTRPGSKSWPPPPWIESTMRTSLITTVPPPTWKPVDAL